MFCSTLTGKQRHVSVAERALQEAHRRRRVRERVPGDTDGQHRPIFDHHALELRAHGTRRRDSRGGEFLFLFSICLPIQTLCLFNRFVRPWTCSKRLRLATTTTTTPSGTPSVVTSSSASSKTPRTATPSAPCSASKRPRRRPVKPRAWTRTSKPCRRARAQSTTSPRTRAAPRRTRLSWSSSPRRATKCCS